MKTLFLNEFLVLAEQLNFSNAAKRLGINQSALSRHIKQLEEELGTPLFSRTTQKIELTAYGNAFIPHAVAIMEHEKAYERAADAIRHDTAHRISLGVCGFPGYYGITALFSDFKTRHPDSIIDVRMGSTEDMLGRLQSGILDIAFVHDTGGLTEDYAMIPYREDYLSVSLPVRHPLAKAKALHLSDLKDEVFFIRHKKDSTPWRFEIQALQNAGFAPKISSSKSAWEDSVINRSNEVSLVKQGLADKLRGNLHVAVVDLEPRIHTDLYLIYPKSRRLAEIVSAFVNFTAESRTPL
ncbi:MAG: LysR family transcriptional regulator [Lachnospiraceae bacterium]|nr:LysR family transcriptional regulator [Lachnospiraceae bacterium]